MKIVVTGGTGFIGSHTVVELVNAGHEPIIIDNFSNSYPSVLKGLEKIIGSEPIFYEGDCGDKQLLAKIFSEHSDIEGIIHFAAHKAVGESVQKPLLYYGKNIGSIVALLELMAEHSINSFVFSSSCTVYGQPKELPVTEDAPVQPAMSPYGNTKQICEEILVDVTKSGQPLKALALRYFNPIGAHESAEIGELPIGVPANLVPFITQTAIGIREKLSVFGTDFNTKDGTAVRDYIHVVDLAKAHVQAVEFLDKQKEEPFYDFINLGTGTGSSVLEVVHAFEKATGVQLNYELTDRRPGDVEQVYAGVGKSTTLLGWETEKSLEDALMDAWRWQQKLAEKSA